MNFLSIFLSFLLFSIQVFIRGDELADERTQNAVETIFSKLFLVRRQENRQLLKILAENISYERRYEMINAAYGKLLMILQEKRNIIENTEYEPMVDKFPKNRKDLIDAITVLLGNTCLFGEVILHFPDISYGVLEKNHRSVIGGPDVHWRDLINWCLKYAELYYDGIVDEEGQKLLSLLDQEINPERRTPDFINPYRNLDAIEQPKKKTVKKLTRGPRLSGHNEL